MFGIHLNLSSIDPTRLENIWKPLEVVSDAVETARDMALDVGVGVRDMTAGVVIDLAHGDVGEACASFVRGADRAVLQSCERFDYGLLYGAQHAVDIVAGALGPVGRPIQAVADRGFDIAFTAVDTSYSVVREEARLVPDMATGLVTDVERSVELASRGQWSAAAGQLAMAGVNVATAPAASMIDIGLTFTQAGVSMAQTALFMEPAGRPLTDAEVSYLKKVYGNDAIDYGLVRIKEEGLLDSVLDAHTIGNTLYLPPDAFNPNGSWAPGKRDYDLAHEVGHVWQNQSAGLDYILRALGAQVSLWAQTGDPMAAYYWQNELAKGKTFATMNPEAQAEAINDLRLALKGDNTIDASDVADLTGRNLSPAEIAFLTSLASTLGWGTGAG
jgi:hypothetical protein